MKSLRQSSDLIVDENELAHSSKMSNEEEDQVVKVTNSENG